MVRIKEVLTYAQYVERNDWGRANGFYHGDVRIFGPGTAWPCPWYFDPLGELGTAPGATRRRPMIGPGRKGELGFLSVHYWRDWADVRAPIAVVCPNGEVWEVDRKSSNGDGWRVEGLLPDITCTPSIVVTGYHGFLRGGEFTADLEGRGPEGVRAPDPGPPPAAVPPWRGTSL